MEWSGSLELPLQAAVTAFEALGLGDRLPVSVCTGPPGGVTPLSGTKSGETPSGSAQSVTTASASHQSGPVDSIGHLATVNENPREILEWLGEEGSLGTFREDAKNPESSLAFSISKRSGGLSSS